MCFLRIEQIEGGRENRERKKEVVRQVKGINESHHGSY